MYELALVPVIALELDLDIVPMVVLALTLVLMQALLLVLVLGLVYKLVLGLGLVLMSLISVCRCIKVSINCVAPCCSLFQLDSRENSLFVPSTKEF